MSNIFDEHFYLMDSGTTIFFNKTVAAHIDFDGLPFLYGQFVLTEVDYDDGQITYIGHFTTELRSFGDEVGDNKIIGNDLDPINGLNSSGTSMSDLDFSKYDHIFSFANIDLSNNSTLTNVTLTGITSYPVFPNFYNNSIGFYYGFIDLEGPNSLNLQEGDRALVSNFRPCIYAKEIWDQIWGKTTYTYQSTFINSPYFKSLVIPYTFDNTQLSSTRNPDGTLDQEFNLGICDTGTTTGDFTGYGPVITHSNTYGVSGRSLVSPNYPVGGFIYKSGLFSISGGTSGIGIPFYKNPDVNLTQATKSNCNWTTTPCDTTPNWIVSQTGNYDISAEIQFNVYFEFVNQTVTQANTAGGDHVNIGASIWCVGPPSYANPTGDIRLLKNETTTINVASQTIYKNSTIFGTDQQFMVSLEGQDLTAGDKIFIELGIQNGLTMNPPAPNQNNVWLVCRNSFCYFKNVYNATSYFNYGDKVRMNSILPPNYNQIDFIKDIMNYFCMVAQPIQGTNTIKIEPWNVFYNVTGMTDYIEWRGPNRDIIDERGKKIESIPDLLYLDFWMNPKEDANDTNTIQYKSNSGGRLFGSIDIPNPYLRSDSYTITTNFASTMMNIYGSTNWKTAQLWNKDNQPTDFNVPPTQTYEPRLLFRKRIDYNATLTPISLLNVYGDNSEYTAASTSTNTVPGTSFPNVQMSFTLTPSDAFFPYSYGDRQVIIFPTINSTSGSTFMLGTYSMQPTGGVLVVQIYYAEGIGTYNSWEINVITDAFFGHSPYIVPPVYSYQPYVGTLDDPYYPSYDINFGLAQYYFTPNTGVQGSRGNINQVFNMYWKNKVLTYIDPNSKYLTVYARVTPADIMNLDFSKKIMIDNGIYILNKLTWTPSDVSMAELIKLSDYPYGFYPYGMIFNDPYSGGGVWSGTSGTSGTSGIGIGNQNDSPNLNGPPSPLTSNRETSGSVLDLMGKQDATTFSTGDSGLTYKIQHTQNYYPKNASGIVSGRGNLITGSRFHCQGDNNVVQATDSTLLNSSGNIVQHDGNILINTSFVTSTDTGKTYITGRDVDSLTDTNYVNTNFYNVNNDINLAGGTNLIAQNYIYIGDPKVDGSFRMSVSGTSGMVFESLKSGTWTNTGTHISPAV
jgi:hypothetical protein